MSYKRFISVFSLVLLSSVFCRAEKTPVYHHFSTMVSQGKVTINSPTNTQARTELCTYTCTSGAVFGFDYFSGDGNKKISINYSAVDQVMTTTAIDSLAGLVIYYYYQNKPSAKVPDIELRLSRDSVRWSAPIEASNDGNGTINASFVPGRYYVRLTSKNGNRASVFAIRYSFGGCNCFLHIPE